MGSARTLFRAVGSYAGTLRGTMLSTFYASPFAPLVGGVMIGLAASLLWLVSGRVAGISGITGGLVDPRCTDRPWRLSFVLGLLGGGFVMSLLLPAAFGTTVVSMGIAVAAGALVGVGTTLANGCTSGHGVCGTATLSKRSIAATATFIGTGILSVYVFRHLMGVGA